MYKKIAFEAGKKDLTILYNVNFGHTSPMAILPLGLKVEVELKLNIGIKFKIC